MGGVGEMIKVLEFVSRRYGLHQVFADVLEMIVCLLSQQQMEERYIEVAKRYKKEDIERLAHFLPHLINCYDEMMDPLGALYMEINSRGKSSMMGQFFTPEALCKAMAMMVTPPDSIRIGTLINDCAVGSGRTLLAIHHNLQPYKRMFPIYVAQDLDKMCVNMTTINMCLNGMFGYIIHGNTISLETYGGYEIIMRNKIPCVQPLSVERAEAIARGPLQEKETIQVQEQLTLF